MILILSDEEEPTTDLVIDWLIYLKKEFVRISINNALSIEKIYETQHGFEACFSYQKNGETKRIDTKNITSYWYRRSQLRISLPLIKTDDEGVDKMLMQHICSEYKSSLEILNGILNKKPHINRFEDNKISKIGMLAMAKEVGLRTPETLICTTKEELYPFYEKLKGEVITKNIGDPLAIFNEGYHCFTSKVDIDNVPEKFGLTLFQEMIKKKVELRIYYVKGEFYGSAIFSQSDPQTQLDFKNYNTEKPNRVIPYRIDGYLKEKLQVLMDRANLNSGSIDVILTTDYQYVFLEVNPVGQFEQVSIPCNYQLFRKVAEMLC